MMVASTSPRRASLPCIQVCILDPVTGLCEGCGRMSEAERRVVMDALDERMRRAFGASAEVT